MNTVTVRLHGSRTYAGEATAEKLLAWLNTSGDDDRVKHLLAAAEKRRAASEVATAEMFMTLVRKMAKGEIPKTIENELRRAPDPDLPKRGQQTAFAASQRAINEILDAYKLSPYLIWTVDGKWTTGWRLALGHSETPEVTAVMALLQLAAEGLLHRVRRCKLQGCRRFFFARFERSEFCRTECQQRHYQTDADFKKEHAAEMRKNRAKNKAANMNKAITLHTKSRWGASRIAAHLNERTSTIRHWLLNRTRR
jgi:predicted RNA-binding Zn ribbon-like protein